MRHAIGFDLGTSALKAVLVDEVGRVVRSARQAYPFRSPQAGWVEQDPDGWWQALQTASRALLDDGPAPDVVGLAGQMHSAVVLGPAATPLCPAILWNDQRTVRACVDIKERFGDQFRTWTGNPIRTAFTATKILWLRQHHPDLYAGIRAVLLPKDFLRLRLTGGLATDVTDASGTGVFDVGRRQWSGDALDALAIDRAWLPEVHESPTLVGQIDARGAQASGLPEGVPVGAGAGDQAAAALGSGAVGPGVLAITLGTSATVQLASTVPQADAAGVFQSFCHAIPDVWQVLAAVLSGGGSLDWYRALADGPERSVTAAPDQAVALERLCRLAASVPPGAAGLIFLPHLTGEAAPHVDPDARGAWFGLTRRHDRRHLARAVIEGVAFAIRGVVDAAEAFAGRAREIRVTGGGSHGAIWLQTIADVLGRRIEVAGTADASARGAALLAIAALTGREPQRLVADWAEPSRPIDPAPETHDRYEAHYAIYREIYPATRHLMHRLTDLDRTS